MMNDIFSLVKAARQQKELLEKKLAELQPPEPEDIEAPEPVDVNVKDFTELSK